MKCRFCAISFVCLGLGLTGFTSEAFAMEEVKCMFKWHSKASQNIQCSQNCSVGSMIVTKKVRSREARRLLEPSGMRWSNARVTSAPLRTFGGKYCYINHPENTRIDLKVERTAIAIDPNKFVNCEKIPALVKCIRGNENFESSASRVQCNW